MFFLCCVFFLFFCFFFCFLSCCLPSLLFGWRFLIRMMGELGWTAIPHHLKYQQRNIILLVSLLVFSFLLRVVPYFRYGPVLRDHDPFLNFRFTQSLQESITSSSQFHFFLSFLLLSFFFVLSLFQMDWQAFLSLLTNSHGILKDRKSPKQLIQVPC